MRKRYYTLIILTVLLASCSTPGESVDTVGTIVSGTLNAQTPGAASPDILTDVPASYLLPASLFFLDQDGSGLDQIYRLAQDGVSLTQVTYEPADVGGFDVSRLDGRLVYVSNNQLLLVAADGSGRQTLLDGGPLTANDSYYTNRISSPRWAPDGRVVFGFGGLNVYDFNTGTTTNVLSNVVEYGGGYPLPRELFSPIEFSPDGTRLLVSIGWMEGGTMGIYDIASGALTPPSLQGIFCCSTQWAPDSSAVYVASSSYGMISSGLWRFDAVTGLVATLLSSDVNSSTFNFADLPLIGPDGQLYFLFSYLNVNPEGHTPLYLVRSAVDGVTGRTALYPESLTDINGGLWAPDASLLVLARAIPDTDYEWEGGQFVIYYMDGRSPLGLNAVGRYMRWGP